MIDFIKIRQTINNHQWSQLQQYLDQMILKDSQIDQKKWLIDYIDEKKQIIKMISNSYGNINNLSITQNKNDKTQAFEQTILKIFSKGFIIPQLNYSQDIAILTKIIQSSQNKKYLLMIYEETIYQLRSRYQNQQNQQIIEFKFLSILPAFISLIGQNVFSDIYDKYTNLFNLYRKLLQTYHIQSQSNQELKLFMNLNVQTTIFSLQNVVNNVQQYKSIFSLLGTKTKNKAKFIDFLKLLHENMDQKQQKQRRVILIVNKTFQLLQLQVQQCSLSSYLWLSQNLPHLQQIYHKNYLFKLISLILIKQLPQKPQFTKINKNLYVLISWVCKYLVEKQQPFQSITREQNQQFIISLFQRLAIILGFLNHNVEQHKHIDIMLANIFNKKLLFSNTQLNQILWRTLVLKHEDINFKLFCLNQYKKVFSTPLSNPKIIKIMKKSTQLTLKLVQQLQDNSRAQKIGFYITFVIYYLSFSRKLRIFFNKSQNSNKNQIIVFNYFFNGSKRQKIGVKIRQKLYKVKQTIKDRLQVSKMKSQSIVNEQLALQNNQLSMCIYRIQQINFQ